MVFNLAFACAIKSFINIIITIMAAGIVHILNRMAEASLLSYS